jgi:hypothetical protein
MKLDPPATQSRPEAAMAAFAKSWRRARGVKITDAGRRVFEREATQ